jgi:hypothetical protein
MTEKRLKELIPDCVGYPIRTQKQTEDLRKVVVALIDTTETLGILAPKHRGLQYHENIEIIEQITGIKYEDLKRIGE